jgi:hypothetical protein
MRRLAIVLAAAALLPWAAWAQATVLRSGEHETFTRLAFPARMGVGWRIEREGPRDATVSFDDAALDFDLRETFARIQRRRILDVGASGGTLRLALGCDCAVSIDQLASGHVMIDVADADARPSHDLRPTNIPRLPLQLELPAFVPTFAVSDPIAVPSDLSPERPDPGGQILVRPNLPRPASAAAEVVRAAEARCGIEGPAADLLRRDPAEALLILPRLRRAVYDESGALDASALTALGETYLAAGFGAEADGLMARAAIDPADRRRLLARLLDGTATPPAPGLLDPGCGPATALLMQLAPETVPPTGAALHEVIAFFEGLPAARRSDLAPRLSPTLAEALREVTLASGLGATEASGAEPIDPAAGTDMAAVREVIDGLGPGWRADAPDAALRLDNALALRPSVPLGAARRELDSLLVARLTERGNVATAAGLVAEDGALARRALQAALDTLPPETAVEAIVRLAPALPVAAPERTRAAGLLLEFGLPGLARGIDPGASTVAPDVALDPMARAWLDRDLATVAALSDGPRPALARLVRQRNAAPRTAGDFAAAQQALDEAGRLEAALDALLADASPAVTEP